MSDWNSKGFDSFTKSAGLHMPLFLHIICRQIFANIVGVFII
jgi:hypothetical protein